MQKYFINIGDQFGRLTVIEKRKDKRNRTCCLCRCVCGKEKEINLLNLVKGYTQSCGCLQKEVVRKTMKKKNEYRFEEDYVVGLTSKGEEFYVDKNDYDKVCDYCWSKQKNGYITASVDGKSKTMHRFLMSPPPEKVVDHINHNRADNRRSNLRICTTAENARNRLVPPIGITTKKFGKKTYYSVFLRGKYYGNFKDYQSAINKRDEVWKEICND